MSPTAGLAVLNFFLADVHGGLGPFLATWLAAAEWSPARIGLVMTASGIAGLVFNGPAGALADRSGRPRVLLGLAAGAVVLGTLGMLPVHSFTGVMVAQIASAAGGAMMGPAMTALTLGLVGHRGFPWQQGRNEAWNHAGNVTAALIVAALASWLGAVSAFWVLAGMAAGSILSLVALRSAEVDLASAHGAPPRVRWPTSWVMRGCSLSGVRCCCSTSATRRCFPCWASAWRPSAMVRPRAGWRPASSPRSLE